MCHLLFNANKEVTGLCQIKGVLIIFCTSLTDQSESIFPYACITNILHIHCNTPENIPSLVENPVSHGRKVKQQVRVSNAGCTTFFIGSRLHLKQSEYSKSLINSLPDWNTHVHLCASTPIFSKDLQKKKEKLDK